MTFPKTFLYSNSVLNPNNGLGSEDKAGMKKIRTTFTVQQISELENNFVNKKYLTSAERAELFTDLGVTQQQVGRQVMA